MQKPKINKTIDMLTSLTKIKYNIVQWYARIQEISDTRKIFQISPKTVHFYNFYVILKYNFLFKTLALKLDLIRS